MNTKEMFIELENFWKDHTVLASSLVKEAYNRQEEFGDCYRAYFILMLRCKRTLNA